jgi:hypothetical protein
MAGAVSLSSEMAPDRLPASGALGMSRENEKVIVSASTPAQLR